MDSDLPPSKRGASHYAQPIAPRENGMSPIAPAPSKNSDGDESPASNGRSGGGRSTSTKRAHKRTYQALMTGPRLLLPLKKKDGEALWRKDIQYDFLNAVFSDKTRAFTKEVGSTEKVTFAELYLQAMANSTKCSKILGEKLLGDHQAGIKIAMVCLLVNWGRMNTTLNFFPEMKTVLRTYHPIPSLQTHDAQDYKQLQDAPRLKSILKGACDGLNEPVSMQDLENYKRRPRTNPINLVFLLSAFSRVVSRDMIPPDREFTYFDLLMDTMKSSESRARAFLWLVWAYLEAPNFYSNSQNPYGSEIPYLKPLDSDASNNENIDTPAELLFGNQMTLQRLAILEAPGSSTNIGSGAGNGSASADVDSSSNSATDQEKQEKPEKPEKHEKTEKASELPLVTPKPRLRSAKDRRINDEFNALLRSKRNHRKARRLARNNAMRDTWNCIQDLDPIYDSDEDRAQAKINGKSHGLGPGVLATGISSKHSDYGEHSQAVAVSLKRIAKRLVEK